VRARAILALMRSLPTPRALRFALMFAAFGVAACVGVAVGCGPDNIVLWTCINPATGKLDPNIYDADHYVNGVLDPCNCYDPCGPEKTCPIVVDAGPLPPGCETGTDGGGGSGGDGSG
jgi:hypothetical protein